MPAKYTGSMGPADAMSALSPEFDAAYAKCCDALMAAVVEFEKATGRTVDSLELTCVDVTTFADARQRLLRRAQPHFLPKPGEVAW